MFSSRNTERAASAAIFPQCLPPRTRVSIRAPERQPHPCKGETRRSLSPETGPHLPAAILSLASRCSSASFGARRFLQPSVSQLDSNAVSA